VQTHRPVNGDAGATDTQAQLVAARNEATTARTLGVAAFGRGWGGTGAATGTFPGALMAFRGRGKHSGTAR